MKPVQTVSLDKGKHWDGGGDEVRGGVIQEPVLDSNTGSWNSEKSRHMLPCGYELAKNRKCA